MTSTTPSRLGFDPAPKLTEIVSGVEPWFVMVTSEVGPVVPGIAFARVTVPEAIFVPIEAVEALRVPVAVDVNAVSTAPPPNNATPTAAVAATGRITRVKRMIPFLWFEQGHPAASPRSAFVAIKGNQCVGFATRSLPAKATKLGQQIHAPLRRSNTPERAGKITGDL